ncbi:hypothetical protein OF83DRAFT_924227 [Amylostereum chailletii]|nr:hypothetical protein OF83DRAFT_924227 [Amylostereum chailletii]
MSTVGTSHRVHPEVARAGSSFDIGRRPRATRSGEGGGGPSSSLWVGRCLAGRRVAVLAAKVWRVAPHAESSEAPPTGPRAFLGIGILAVNDPRGGDDHESSASRAFKGSAGQQSEVDGRNGAESASAMPRTFSEHGTLTYPRHDQTGTPVGLAPPCTLPLDLEGLECAVSGTIVHIPVPSYWRRPESRGTGSAPVFAGPVTFAFAFTCR